MNESAANGLALVSYVGVLVAPVVAWAGWPQLGAGLSMISLVSILIAWVAQEATKGKTNGQ